MPYNGYIDVPDMNLDPNAINMTDPGYQAYRKAAAADAAAVPADPSADVAGGNMGNTTPPPDAPVRQAAAESLAAPAPSADTSQDPDAGLPGVDATGSSATPPSGNPIMADVTRQLAAPPGGGVQPSRNTLPQGYNFQNQPRADGVAPAANGVTMTIGGSGKDAISAEANPQTQAMYDKMAAIMASRVQPHTNYAINNTTGEAISGSPTIDIPRMAWDNAVSGNIKNQQMAHEEAMAKIPGQNALDLAKVNNQGLMDVENNRAKNAATLAQTQWDRSGKADHETQLQLNNSAVALNDARTNLAVRQTNETPTLAQQNNGVALDTIRKAAMASTSPRARQLVTDLAGETAQTYDPNKWAPRIHSALDPNENDFVASQSGPGGGIAVMKNYIEGNSGYFSDNNVSHVKSMMADMENTAASQGYGPDAVNRLHQLLGQFANQHTRDAGVMGARNVDFTQGGPQVQAQPSFLPPSRQEAYPGANAAASLFGW